MSESQNTGSSSNAKLSNTVGQVLGWIGIIAGVIGFFWQSIVMGIAAIVLGVIGLFSPQRNLNIVAIIVGVVAMIIGLV